jgi:hypothetical protein
VAGPYRYKGHGYPVLGHSIYVHGKHVGFSVTRLSTYEQHVLGYLFQFSKSIMEICGSPLDVKNTSIEFRVTGLY